MGSGAWDNKGTDISGNGAVDWAEYKRGTPLNGDIIMVFTKICTACCSCCSVTLN